MLSHLVITIVGRDRPGLVEQLAATIASHGGNWQASTMSQLSGQFAGILQLTVEPPKQDALIQALDKLPDLQILIAHGEDIDSPDVRQAFLEITANDRPGIVQEISQVLAKHQVNVEQLETQTQSAPNWGNPLFQAKLQLSVPRDVSEQTLTETLESLADDLMVDLRFELEN